MRLGPRHNEEGKGCGHGGIARIYRAPAEPRIMPPLLQRAKNGMQERREERKHHGKVMPRLCALK